MPPVSRGVARSITGRFIVRLMLSRRLPVVLPETLPRVMAWNLVSGIEMGRGWLRMSERLTGSSTSEPIRTCLRKAARRIEFVSMRVATLVKADATGAKTWDDVSA
jgi:hypothetical protein